MSVFVSCSFSYCFWIRRKTEWKCNHKYLPWQRVKWLWGGEHLHVTGSLVSGSILKEGSFLGDLDLFSCLWANDSNKTKLSVTSDWPYVTSARAPERLRESHVGSSQLGLPVVSPCFDGFLWFRLFGLRWRWPREWRFGFYQNDSEFRTLRKRVCHIKVDLLQLVTRWLTFEGRLQNAASTV